MHRQPPAPSTLSTHSQKRSRWQPLHHTARTGRVAVAALALFGSWPTAHPATAAPAPATLASNLPSGRSVGTTITWLATATTMKDAVYRFSIDASDQKVEAVRDFSPASTFDWTPLSDGVYTVHMTAKDGFNASSAVDAATTFTVASRVKGGTASVTRLSNPLVVLYSTPACTSGTVRVMFRPDVKGSTWTSMTPRQCTAGTDLNVVVARMQAHTHYLLRHVVSTGTRTIASPTLSFATGTPSAGLKISKFVLKTAPTTQSDSGAPYIFHALNANPSSALANPIITDLKGNLVWYYNTLSSGLSMVWPLHILQGGNVLLLGRDSTHKTGDNVLREINAAGSVVRETTIAAVNAQIARRGQLIYAFHHDAIRLPNDSTVTLGETQQMVKGKMIMGDIIIALDKNFNVSWTWSMFDHLQSPAVFPAALICKLSYPGSLCALPDQNAYDWTHANSLGYSPEEGDLTLSIRHLDLVLKIDYRNGAGAGAIVWKFGKGGSFKLASNDKTLWFSHQHNADLINPTTVLLYDNGNTRCLAPGAKNCQSRGQEWKINQKTRTATPIFSATIGTFSQALGSAQLLSNGNLTFGGGYPSSREVEYLPNGTPIYELDTTGAEYRAYRLKTLTSF